MIALLAMLQGYPAPPPMIADYKFECQVTQNKRIIVLKGQSRGLGKDLSLSIDATALGLPMFVSEPASMGGSTLTARKSVGHRRYSISLTVPGSRTVGNGQVSVFEDYDDGDNRSSKFLAAGICAMTRSAL